MGTSNKNDSVNIISRWYRKNRINLDEIFDSTEFPSKKNLIRAFVVKQDDKHFLNYPEFFIEKMTRYYRFEYDEELIKMTKNIKKRSDVYKFLNNDKITVEDIMCTGW